MVKPSPKLRRFIYRRLMNGIIKRRDSRKKRRLSLKAKAALITGIVCFLLLVLPALVAQNWNPVNPNQTHIQTSGTTVAVLNHQTNTVMTLPLETYLVGVVAAEMPATFEPEALKVQAIVARTYVLKRLDMYTASPNPEHPEADICTDSRHCQAWKSEAELRQQWGLIKFPMYYKKIIAAVESTKNKIITNEAKLIDPVYHSTCGGRTENSEDVWAKAIPYLRSVPCKWDQTAPRYEEQLTLTWAEVEERLQFPIILPAAGNTNKSTKHSTLIQAEAQSPTGRLKTIQVGSHVISATEFRNRLNLNSTQLSWVTDSEKVTFTTRGYGHGVGLCQYGAEGQAKAGKNHEEIIQYYYQGVEIRQIGH